MERVKRCEAKRQRQSGAWDRESSAVRCILVMDVRDSCRLNRKSLVPENVRMVLMIAGTGTRHWAVTAIGCFIPRVACGLPIAFDSSRS